MEPATLKAGEQTASHFFAQRWMAPSSRAVCGIDRGMTDGYTAPDAHGKPEHRIYLRQTRQKQSSACSEEIHREETESFDRGAHSESCFGGREEDQDGQRAGESVRGSSDQIQQWKRKAVERAVEIVNAPHLSGTRETAPRGGGARMSMIGRMFHRHTCHTRRTAR